MRTPLGILDGYGLVAQLLMTQLSEQEATQFQCFIEKNERMLMRWQPF
jgi:hypothetical protein